MLPYKRSARVGDLMREEIADIIMHKVKDPRIGFVTVTGVNVTADLRNARVYVSILNEGERENTMKALSSAKNFIKSELGRRIRIKYLPEIEFKIDTSIEYGAKIDSLLKKLKGEDEGSA